MIAKSTSATPIVEFAPEGEYMALRLTGTGKMPSKSERGQIRGFSLKSRSRLMKMLAKLNKRYIPLFVTLTYHEKYPDMEGAKQHLRALYKRLARAYKTVGMVWKSEYQMRGVPHFHLLVWGVELEYLQKFIPGAWVDIVDPGNETMLAFHEGRLGNEHCVQVVRSWHGVKSYAAKYMSKVVEFAEGEKTGRCWGVVGLVPLSKVLEFRVNMEAALQWRRAFRKHSKWSLGRFGFWSYHYHVDWLLYLDYCIKSFQFLDPNMPENFPPGWWRTGINQEDTEVLT